MPKPTNSSSHIAPKTPTPQNSPPPGHHANRRCYKRHDLGIHSFWLSQQKGDYPGRGPNYPGGRDEGRKEDLFDGRGRQRGDDCWTRWGRNVGNQKSPQCPKKCQGWTKGEHFPQQMYHLRQSMLLDHRQWELLQCSFYHPDWDAGLVNFSASPSLLAFSGSIKVRACKLILSVWLLILLARVILMNLWMHVMCC